MRHTFSPRAIRRTKLRHPVVAAFLIGNDDGLSAIRRQNHRAIFQLRQKTTIGTGPARLLKRKVQISAIHAKGHKDAVEAGLSCVFTNPLPAPVTLR